MQLIILIVLHVDPWGLALLVPVYHASLNVLTGVDVMEFSFLIATIWRQQQNKWHMGLGRKNDLREKWTCGDD